jgi:hypothetical protein
MDSTMSDERAAKHRPPTTNYGFSPHRASASAVACVIVASVCSPPVTIMLSEQFAHFIGADPETVMIMAVWSGALVALTTSVCAVALVRKRDVARVWDRVLLRSSVCLAVAWILWACGLSCAVNLWKDWRRD